MIMNEEFGFSYHHTTTALRRREPWLAYDMARLFVPLPGVVGVEYVDMKSFIASAVQCGSV